MLHERVSEFVFNVLSTYELIWRRCQGLESHLTDWMSQDQTQNPWVQDEWFIHFTTTAPIILRICIVVYNV